MKQNNDLIGWENCMVLGIPIIDKQHRNLLRILKKIHIACKDADETASHIINSNVHEIIEYLGTHFRTEEKIMLLLEYKGFINHRQIHDDYIRKLIMETALHSMSKYFPGLFIDSIKDWILSHIAIHDQLMSEQIRNMKEYGKFGMLLTKKMEEYERTAN